MLQHKKSIFLIGIKGVAMANLAFMLKKMGKKVTGSDLAEEFITDELLKKNKIAYSIGFPTSNLPKTTDLVVYSAAHGGTENPLAKEAKKRGIRLISQVEIMGELMKPFKTKIAVAGCHGKTTTASLLSYALIQLKKNPSYIVGAPSFNTYAGGSYDGKPSKSEGRKYFIVEADEYGVNPPLDLRPKFLFLDPDFIICPNIDFDHPDVYKDLENTKKAFQTFFDNKNLIICEDDKNAMSVAKRFSKNQYQTYGFSKGADFVISDVKTENSGTSFAVSNKTFGKKQFSISLFGNKNVGNATAVIAMLLILGFTYEEIKKAIQGFTGAKRRFEKVFENKNFSLYDDYGHHPREIEATISAARTHFPHRRIIVIFQPHTYSRTQMFLKEFARALSLADYSYILPIFPSAREDSRKFSVRSVDIVKQGNSKKLSYAANSILLRDQLASTIKKGDIIFTMGAGDVYKLKDEIITLL